MGSNARLVLLAIFGLASLLTPLALAQQGQTPDPQTTPDAARRLNRLNESR